MNQEVYGLNLIWFQVNCRLDTPASCAALIGERVFIVISRNSIQILEVPAVVGEMVWVSRRSSVRASVMGDAFKNEMCHIRGSDIVTTCV